MSNLISQEKLKAMVLPYLKSIGCIYVKCNNIFARRAVENEEVITKTSDGVETKNYANLGDYIVINQTRAGEQYIVPGAKFQAKYKWLKTIDEEVAEYESKGRVVAIQLSKDQLNRCGLPALFYFEAPWKTKMIAKENDFLVTPLDFTEIYRIAAVEFLETYTKEE